MPRYLTATQLYTELINDNIVGATGEIIFNLKNLSVVVNTRDSVGHMLQDWLKEWANHKDIYLRANPGTQEFPDFYLTQLSDDNFLEVKAFNYEEGPAFDIANFESYVQTLLENPKKLDAAYILFGYTLNNGILTIKEVWVKSVWDICGKSPKWGLSLQDKKDAIYNIRPITFYSDRRRIEIFNNKLEFIESIQTILNNYPKTRGNQTDWLDNFKNAYYTATGENL